MDMREPLDYEDSRENFQELDQLAFAIDDLTIDELDKLYIHPHDYRAVYLYKLLHELRDE